MSTLLNLDALANLDSVLGSTSDSQYYFERPSQFPDNSTTYFRLLMPKTYNGMFFFKEIQHWFNLNGFTNTTKVVDPASIYGKDASIIDRIKLENPSVVPLLTNPKTFSKDAPYRQQDKYVIPALIFDNVKWAGPNMSSYTIRNEKVCLLEIPVSVVKELATIIVAPFRMLTAKSIADTEQGFNLALTKTVSNKQTRYKVDCLPTPSAIDAKWEENVDLELFYKRQMYSDDYIKSIVKHFLTGSGIDEAPTYRFPELRDSSFKVSEEVAKTVEFKATEPPKNLPDFSTGAPVINSVTNDPVVPPTVVNTGNDLLSKLKGLS